MLDLALELNSSCSLGLLNHSSCSAGAMKVGRRPLVLEAHLCSLFCASRSPAEHGCFKPLGKGGVKTLQLYITSTH